MTSMRPYRISALAVGAGSAIVQVVMLREFLKVFSGNELVTGVVLCLWMLITAGGAAMGKLRRSPFKTRHIVVVLAVITCIPPVAAFLNGWMRNTFFEPGIVLSFTQIFLWSIVLLLPYCLLSGLLFTMLVSKFPDGDPRHGAKVYGLESAGSFAGGLITGTLLLGLTNNWRILLLVTLVFSAVSAYVLLREKKWIALIIPLFACAGTITFSWAVHRDAADVRALYSGQLIMEAGDSPYGHLVVTKNYEQYSYFCNGSLLFSSQQEEMDEESVHLALMQRKNIKKVLIVGGNAAGILRQIAKYPVIKVDFIEEDPYLVKLQKRYGGTIETPNFRIQITDCRLFLRTTAEQYDAILINTSEPGNLMNNRFFTTEFFQLAKQHLKPNGVFTISLPSSAQYMNENSRALHSSLFNSLKPHFKNTVIYPGARDRFISSDSTVRLDIEALSLEWMLPNVYISSDYINDYAVHLLSKQVKDRLDKTAPVNYDAKPISNYMALRAWLDLAGGAYKTILIVTGLILLIPLFAGRKRGSSLWVTGFTGTAVEVMLLMAYQSAYGHLYSITGLFFAVFMGGMALGAFSLKRDGEIRYRWFWIGQFILAAWCGLLAVVIPVSNYGHPYLLHLLFFLMNFVTAFLCGRQFAVSLRTAPANGFSAGMAYAYDLMGSALGALLIGALLMPIFGSTITVLGIAGLNLIIASLLALKKTH